MSVAVFAFHNSQLANALYIGPKGDIDGKEFLKDGTQKPRINESQSIAEFSWDQKEFLGKSEDQRLNNEFLISPPSTVD